MGRKKSDIKYDTIKIPEGLTDEVDKIVLESKGIYTSRTDVVKTAVREFVERRIESYGREKRISAARADGKQSKLTGDGLAESKERSKGTDKDSKVNAGNQQPDIGEVGEGTTLNLGRDD